MLELAARLSHAAYHGDEAAVRQLLAAGAQADQATENGRLPLHTASFQGHERVVRLLLEAAPATASMEDNLGQTALHHAVKCSPAQAVVRLLLEAAPDTALAVDSYGWTPLHFAAEIGNIEVLKLLLLAAPAAAAMLDADKHAPIHLAASSHNAAAVQLLLEAAPELAFAPDTFGGTPLRLVLLYGRHRPTEQVEEKARCLLRAAPAVQPALGILLQYSHRSATLFADLVARLPLSREQWHSIPAPCTDLARALPDVLQRSTAEAGWLVGRLAEGQRGRLRAAAFGLARAQRQGSAVLPPYQIGRILALAIAV
ncbi:hypothetical protein CHLNCDRAFT_135930 [Chlorella variabilis]|uniref:Uncharacterized protein n=1 Tax=Chlorella variabilis TaxID=554065 RepID=E1ZJE3_CHLVA|nr:hypothetical protein CHLNCDRAFT_135930 [Chlorella variabilis]EFN53845.1 hypothetical protein CHLNCDRAFT_135930 [Chlorella variabilis]|eukprot:XP_005845947.1 hypothetical protein CHLNCDRAFT_135930 [Chlorella variabilis]